MVKLGYKLMSEEHGPAELIANAVKAEKAGFEFAAISDHFFPWLAEQGHAPFAWAVLGGLCQATTRLGFMTAVTCPTTRYHPAIIAQAAATIGLMSNNRFVLGLGSGERLNEHVVGAGWPGVHIRQERLAEAIEIIRKLFAGGVHSHRGTHLQIDHARLFDLPSHKVPIVVAAGGPEAARLAAEQGDGLIITEPKKDLVAQWKKAGGKGPVYAEVGICAAPTKAAGMKTAHKYFRWSLAGWPVMAELPHDDAFKAASETVTPEAVADKISCGPNADDHLAAVAKFTAIGVDHIVLNQIGPDQDFFFDLFRKKMQPALQKKRARG